MRARVILTITLVFLGFIAAILPDKTNSSAQLDAEELLRDLNTQNHTFTSDELADALINQDPSIQLIDLRSESEYKAWHMPGALNIPFRELFDEKWVAYIDQVARRNVFYSNGTTISGEAWQLARQKGYKNNYILSGGLNEWFATIMDPEAPEASATDDELELYSRRAAARMYFTGAKVKAPSANATGAKPLPRRKKKTVAGGCS